MHVKLRFLLVLVSTCSLASCRPEARPVRLGEECAHCRMQVMAPEYAGELVTRKGRQYVFDDAICLVSFLEAEPALAAQTQLVLVADYHHPTTWLAAEAAIFVQSPRLRTPMNGHLVAVASMHEARELAAGFNPPGEVLTWAKVRSALAR